MALEMTRSRDIVEAVRDRLGAIAIERTVVALLQRRLLRTLTEQRQSIAERLWLESDAKPRVERDHRGLPMVPTTDDFAKYFGHMQREFIKRHLIAAEKRWRQVGSEHNQNNKYSKAAISALDRELSAARKALSER